jgi:RNA polymerase sigma-70 factor (ECF subfamily)
MRELGVLSLQKELIIKLKTGDESVFRVIYDQYVNKLYYFALKFVRSPEAAEELVQAVFVKLWESRSQIDINLSFESYLYKITKNHTLNFLKRAAYERQYRVKLKSRYTFSSLDTEEQVDLNESLTIINQAIELLPPKRQKIYKLSRINGVNHDRIALQLGISKNTVKVQIVKATKFIKNHFYKATDVALAFFIFILF